MTGAKLSERTRFGSTEGRSGGSMKLLMRSSKALKSAPAGSVVDGCGRDEEELEDKGGGDELGFLTVVLGGGGAAVAAEGLSSILTEEITLVVVTLRRLLFGLGEWKRRFLVENAVPERKEQDMASIISSTESLAMLLGAGGMGDS